jgi:uroporphyrinogen decarboxylase
MIDSVDPAVMQTFLGRPVSSLGDVVEFYARAGYDCVPWFVGIHTLALRSASPDRADVSRLWRKGHARYSRYTEAEEERSWAEEGSGIVTSWEELESFPWSTVDEVCGPECDQIRQLADLMPPGMRVIPVVGEVFTTAWQLMGMTTFAYSVVDAPELVHALVERLGSLHHEVVERVVGLPGVGALLVGDDLAYSGGLMVSPGFLRREVLPWYREVGQICRRHDLPYVFHSDGNVSEILDDLLDCGVNALHPIEPKCMDIARVKERYGGRLCVMGNIDLGYTLTLGTPAEVEEEVKLRLRQCGPGGGYILGASNSVPDYVPFTNYNAMREACLRYGGYPIRC